MKRYVKKPTQSKPNFPDSFRHDRIKVKEVLGHRTVGIKIRFTYKGFIGVMVGEQVQKMEDWRMRLGVSFKSPEMSHYQKDMEFYKYYEYDPRTHSWYKVDGYDYDWKYY